MADWYLIPAGTVLTSIVSQWEPEKKGTSVRFDNEIRVVDQRNTWNKDREPYFKLGKLIFGIPKELKLPKVKIPPMPREFTSLAVKGSVWEFERDWTFQGYDGSTNSYTIPAGTQVTIGDNKMRVHSFGNYHHTEKAIEVVYDEALRMFGGRWLPAKEASGYLKLVTAGKTKTYWKLLKNDGSALTDKNFANLGNAKSSARYHFGMIKADYDDTGNNHDSQPDYWIENDESLADINDGVIAVQYDHATKTEIAREDLCLWLAMSKMKTS